MAQVFLINPEAPVTQMAGPGDFRKMNTAGGIRLGTLDNTKGNADHLLGYIVEGLRKLVPVASVVALRKNNPSTPAPKPVLDRLAAETDFVVSAMGD